MVSQETHDRIKELINSGEMTNEEKIEYEQLKAKAHYETSQGKTYYNKQNERTVKEVEEVTESFDDPEEINRAVRTPQKKNWKDKLKGVFLKDDDEIELEKDVKREYETTYRKEKREFKLSEARDKARKKAREPSGWGGFARKIKDNYGQPKKTRVKGVKRVKRVKKYVIQDGIAYPLASQTTTVARKKKPAPFKNPLQILGEKTYGPRKQQYDFKGLDDMLGYSPRNKKKKRKPKNPLDMLGGMAFK